MVFEGVFCFEAVEVDVGDKFAYVSSRLYLLPVSMELRSCEEPKV